MDRSTFFTRLAVPAGLAAALAASGTATPVHAQSLADTVAIPGVRVGAVYGLSTPFDLRAAYGHPNVVTRPLPAGEGTTQPGAIVFGGTPREIRVFWQDGSRRRVTHVEIGPRSSAWRTRSGVRIGASLLRVQEINRAPFQIERENDGHNCAGAWGRGRLPGQLLVCFRPARRLTQGQENSISRFQGLRSNHPVVRRTFVVHSMRVRLNATRPPNRVTGPGIAARSARDRCRRFGQLRSRNSNTAMQLTFINRSGAYRSIQWLDFNGRPKQYANLNPGQRWTVNTFLTHPWMITDGPGNCLEIHMPRLGRGAIVLRPDGRNFGPE